MRWRAAGSSGVGAGSRAAINGSPIGPALCDQSLHPVQALTVAGLLRGQQPAHAARQEAPDPPHRGGATDADPHDDRQRQPWVGDGQGHAADHEGVLGDRRDPVAGRLRRGVEQGPGAGLQCMAGHRRAGAGGPCPGGDAGEGLQQVPGRIHAGDLVGEELRQRQRARGAEHPPRLRRLQRRRQLDPAQESGQAHTEHGQVGADPRHPGQEQADHEDMGVGHGNRPGGACGGASGCVRRRTDGYTARPSPQYRQKRQTAPMTEPAPRFRIVPRRRGSERTWKIAIAAAWLLSLAVVGLVSTRLAAPGLQYAREASRQAQREAEQRQRQLEELNQRVVTLERSDQISRAANTELQASLAERDEEIAALRADVAFYERLVGSTSQRKGLSVHSIEFAPEEGGTWRYRAVLTQNLNRGAISQGQMRFTIEGVRDGKLASIGWEELLQRGDAAGQAYSFRYFQELDGSVMLPRDFTPQRVRVLLRGNGGNAEQTFDWKTTASGGGR